MFLQYNAVYLSKVLHYILEKLISTGYRLVMRNEKSNSTDH